MGTQKRSMEEYPGFLQELVRLIDESLREMKVDTRTLRKEYSDRMPTPYTLYLNCLELDLNFSFFQWEMGDLGLSIRYNPEGEQIGSHCGSTCVDVRFDVCGRVDLTVRKFGRTKWRRKRFRYIVMDKYDEMRPERFVYPLYMNTVHLGNYGEYGPNSPGIPIGSFDFAGHNKPVNASVLFGQKAFGEGTDDLEAYLALGDEIAERYLELPAFADETDAYPGVVEWRPPAGTIPFPERYSESEPLEGKKKKRRRKKGESNIIPLS